MKEFLIQVPLWESLTRTWQQGKWWLKFMISSCESYTFQSSLLGQGLSTKGLERRPSIPHWFRDQCVLGRGKGSARTLQFFSFPFVKPVSEPTYMDTFGRSSGRKEKQNRTWLFTFVLVSHSILTATHTIFTYTVKIIQLLVFQSISLSSFRDTGVGMNVPHALTLSCHNPRGKSVKTGLFAIAA